MSSRAGGDTPAYRDNCPILTTTMQELASSGPSAIESFGPEPGGPIAWAEVTGPSGEVFTFTLRCGVFAAGGEHE